MGPVTGIISPCLFRIYFTPFITIIGTHLVGSGRGTEVRKLSFFMFPKIGVPQNGWFMNGWFGGTITFGNTHITLGCSSGPQDFHVGNEGFLRDPLLNMLHSLVVTVPGRVVDQQKSRRILQSVKLIRSPENHWYPQIIHFNRVFHYKPSILGYPYFWKHPYTPPKNHHGTWKRLLRKGKTCATWMSRPLVRDRNDR